MALFLEIEQHPFNSASQSVARSSPRRRLSCSMDQPLSGDCRCGNSPRASVQLIEPEHADRSDHRAAHLTPKYQRSTASQWRGSHIDEFNGSRCIVTKSKLRGGAATRSGDVARGRVYRARMPHQDRVSKHLETSRAWSGLSTPVPLALAGLMLSRTFWCGQCATTLNSRNGYEMGAQLKELPNGDSRDQSS